MTNSPFFIIFVLNKMYNNKETKMNALNKKNITNYKVTFTSNGKVIKIKNVSYMNKESAVRWSRLVSSKLGKNVTFILEKGLK